MLFGVDGSRIQTPRTKANEKRFHPTKKEQKQKRARKGKAPQLTKKTVRRDKQAAKRKQAAKKAASKKKSEKQSAGPQIWLTLLWHVGMRLPWAWKTGPVDSSERGDMLEMLDVLPENSMITADAGFIGYDFWQAIDDADHAFVIRVGANVKLLTKIGYAREYSNRVYLWPDNALWELDWSLIGLWVVNLLAVNELIEHGESHEHGGHIGGRSHGDSQLQMASRPWRGSVDIAGRVVDRHLRSPWPESLSELPAKETAKTAGQSHYPVIQPRTSRLRQRT